jgi:ELWxxDGT repeat protein
VYYPYLIFSATDILNSFNVLIAYFCPILLQNQINMKNITKYYVLLMLFFVSYQDASAQTAVLLKDINTTTTGVPSSPTKGIWMGSNYYFAANDGMNGVELWKSDGTAGNTNLLKDIFPGNGSSSPSNFAIVGTTLFFSANDGATGVELWKTDGTAAGTVLVKDIRSGAASAGPTSLFQTGSFLLFTATDVTTGQELWKSDGTAAGTVMVKEIVPGPTGAGIGRVVGTGTKIYFGASAEPGNNELWKSDGTAAGTVLVKDIYPGTANGSLFGAVFGFGETLYFAANNGTNGLELWKSDGTTAGTVMLKDLNTAGDGNPQNFTVMGGKIYFTGVDATNGSELWVTDGTAAGTTLVKDIFPGTSNGAPVRLTALGSTIYFRATDGTNGVELWKSNGTAAGTVMVKDINTSAAGASSSPDQFAVIGTNIFFQANDGVNGAELWKSDGTAGGTVLLKDIQAGAIASTPTNVSLNPSATYFLFSADNGVNGAELWKSDGTAGNTALLKNINADNGNSAIASLTALGSKVVFSANNGTNGQEIWGTDGTVAGTSMLMDINTSVAGASSNPARFANSNGTVYFAATTGATATGTEFYKTNGTAAGTVLIKDINTSTTGASSNPQNFIYHNGFTYFAANDGVNGSELFRSDGTAANTALVKDIAPGSGGSVFGGSSSAGVHAISAGGVLFFQALDQPNNIGFELYSSTGAIGNATLIKDINTSSLAANSAPNNFVYLGSGTTVYFSANDGVNGEELWKTDNTAAGTAMVKDITVGAESTTFSRFIALGSKFYFSAYSATDGIELWQSDGTSAGTVVLKNINPGLASSDPQNLTLCGSYIYFSADNGTNGRELWRTDGTAAGTIMVTDIVSGSGSSNPANFFYHPTLQSVFFSANTPANGTELWEYDGTTSRLYTEVVAGTGSSNPGPIMLAGNNLIFVGTNGSNGLELYGVETYNSWSGATNTVWSTNTNWKKNLVPGAAESALLPSTGVTNEAALDVNASVVRLEVSTGRTLTLNATRTLTVTDLVVNKGTIKGTGTLANTSFTNAGIVAPGNSPGILNITGAFINQGTLQIELGGLTVGTQYDRLAVSGAFTAGGTLAISKVNGFGFAAGQSFTIVTAASVTGTFSSITWPAGVTGNVAYNATNIVINVTAAVPLTLLDFNARAAGDQAALAWSTADELNTSHFIIERSNDGIHYSFLERVAAIGAGANSYTTLDSKPMKGNNYYRLKMTDFDGRFTYSNVAVVRFAGVKGLIISPVPATDYINITLKDAGLSGKHVRIYNTSGGLMKDMILTADTRIDIAAWAKGMYTIKAEGESYSFVKQ